jgi:arsenate reductase
LLELARMLGTGVGPMMRKGEVDYREAGDLPEGDDRELAEWLSRHPRVLERPIVVDEAAARAVIGRPPENVLELLGRPGGQAARK